MCKTLKLCTEALELRVEKRKQKGCHICLYYVRNNTKVFSPKMSFNSEISLCDCIIQCNNKSYYLLVEIKDGRVHEEDAEHLINQLKNCEQLLREKCKVKLEKLKKVLIYGGFRGIPAAIHLIKDELEKAGIDYHTIESLEEVKKKKNLCQFLQP